VSREGISTNQSNTDASPVSREKNGPALEPGNQEGEGAGSNPFTHTFHFTNRLVFRRFYLTMDRNRCKTSLEGRTDMGMDQQMIGKLDFLGG
jgi:hypothetical protein